MKPYGSGYSGVPGESPNAVHLDDKFVKASVLEFMRNKYPDSATYKDGNILLQPTSNYVSMKQEKVLDMSQGIYQLQSNRDRVDFSGQGVFKINDADVYQVAPLVDEDSLEDLVDDGFSFFVEEEEEEELVEVPEFENDIFITMVSTELNDCHDMYLRLGPGANSTPIGNDTFCVFYIDQGVARPIPNYETLEVMLIERQIGYESIRIGTEEDNTLYNINSNSIGPLASIARYEETRMPDRYQEWNLQFRLESGYRPVAPFLRDPGNYYDPTNINDLGTPYDRIVYEEANATEKLRDKFEGKMVCFNTTARGPNNDGKPEIDIVGADINSVRIMTYGFWKLPIELETYRAYNELMDIGAEAPFDNMHVNWIDRFNKAGFMTSFQGGSGGSFIAGWNDFPHIAGANTLDREEYYDYFDSNGGDVFDVDYLAPYEPRGSIQYYSSALSIQLQAESIEDMQALQDQYTLQQQMNALRVSILNDLKDLKNQCYSGIESLSVSFNELAGPIAIRTRATVLKNDLMNYWHTSSGNKWTYYRKKRTSNGDKKKGDSKGFWSLIENEMNNSHEKICVAGFVKSLEDFDVACPVDNSTQTRLILSATELTDKSAINKKIRELGASIVQYLDAVLGNIVPAGGGGMIMGGVFAEAWQDVKDSISGVFQGIGDFFDDLFASFGRFDISSVYTDKSNIHKQITSYGGSYPWGGSGKYLFTSTQKGDYGFAYYGSPIYGEMTPFDESIENILGSEEFTEAKGDAIEAMTELKDRIKDKIERMEDEGYTMSQSRISYFQNKLAEYTDDYDNAVLTLPVPAANTMHNAFDIVAKRWIAKSHNQVERIRAHFRSEKKKWFIGYNPLSRNIVKKYFPNLPGSYFKNKSYKKIPYGEIN